jgi:alginate O-acetyltransferase complex protein AlgI
MLFQTPEFLAFFVIVVAAVALVRGDARKLVLLIASWIFYGWSSPRFLIPLLITTFVDYAIGLALEKQRSRMLVAVSVAANLTMLALLRIEPGWLHMAVPLGISFYTFHSISYIVDVYRGELPACRSPLDYALFIAFFPELVAGPIVRGKQFLPQLAREVVIRIDEFAVLRVTRGLAKKVLIADNVAVFVNAVFADPSKWPSIVIWIATIGFAVQIYCDFSGYTDIAIGLAHVFGFELPINFDRPYLARNPRDFWRRWHISLSSWLRDYLYVPLGGNRKHVLRNIMITMLLGGLWHGASWNFVLWGAMHGLLLIAYRLWQRPRSLCVTQLFVLFTWIAFRVREPHAMLIAMRKFVLFDFDFALAGRGLLTMFFFSTIALIAAFITLHATRIDLARLRTPALVAACIGIGIAFFFLWPADQTAFIYFQF